MENVPEKSRNSMNKKLIITSEEDMYYAKRIMENYLVELQM